MNKAVIMSLGRCEAGGTSNLLCGAAAGDSARNEKRGTESKGREER